MRQSTVLHSGDAVEKLLLEPIVKIAGEVRLLRSTLHISHFDLQSARDSSYSSPLL